MNKSSRRFRTIASRFSTPSTSGKISSIRKPTTFARCSRITTSIRAGSHRISCPWTLRRADRRGWRRNSSVSVLDDLGIFLQDNGFGMLGQTIFLGTLPQDSPGGGVQDQVLALLEAPGL